MLSFKFVFGFFSTIFVENLEGYVVCASVTALDEGEVRLADFLSR